MWGSLSHVASVHPGFYHLALGLAWPWDKGSVCTCPYPPKLTLLGLWWPLAFALICLGFMPKHPSSSASRWRGEKLNKRCFLLPEALLHFIKPFRDNSRSRRELTTCFTIIKLMQLPSLFRALQLRVCWNAFLDRGPKMLGYVSAAVSSTSSYLLFFSRTQGIT